MVRDIGKFIKEMRKTVGLTQKELAGNIGVSDKTISKWENGNGTPDTSMLLPLCKELNITVNELLSCEKIPSENYSMKAEETIMTLMEENERTKKGNRISQIIGGIVALIAILFLAISSVRGSFPILNYFDIPSFIIVGLLAVGVVLISGARKKEKILFLLSKTILPIGLLVSIVSAIIVLSYIDEIKLIGPSLAVVLLSLLYSVLVKIIVEVLRVRE